MYSEFVKCIDDAKLAEDALKLSFVLSWRNYCRVALKDARLAVGSLTVAVLFVKAMQARPNTSRPNRIGS
jgi:hypothetical protein